MALINTAPGVYPDVPEDAYHADPHSLSFSSAKLLLPPSCPAKFKWVRDHPKKAERAFDIGHVAHRLILGKGAEYKILTPQEHGLTKGGEVSKAPRNTDMWKEADAEARKSGLVPIHVDDWIKADNMAAAVLGDEHAGPLFAEGVAEQSMYAEDPQTGVMLRGRTDWFEPNGDIDDVKTTALSANPAELQRQFYKLSYYMQAAWYIDLAIALGLSTPQFRFVVVEKEPPHLVSVLRYTPEAIEEGRRQNRRAIDLYAQCLDSETWPSYTDGVTDIDLPRWAYRDGMDTAAAELIAELEGITA